MTEEEKQAKKKKIKILLQESQGLRDEILLEKRKKYLIITKRVQKLK